MISKDAYENCVDQFVKDARRVYFEIPKVIYDGCLGCKQFNKLDLVRHWSETHHCLDWKAFAESNPLDFRDKLRKAFTEVKASQAGPFAFPYHRYLHYFGTNEPTVELYNERKIIDDKLVYSRYREIIVHDSPSAGYFPVTSYVISLDFYRSSKAFKALVLAVKELKKEARIDPDYSFDEYIDTYGSKAP